MSEHFTLVYIITNGKFSVPRDVYSDDDSDREGKNKRLKKKPLYLTRNHFRLNPNQYRWLHYSRQRLVEYAIDPHFRLDDNFWSHLFRTYLSRDEPNRYILDLSPHFFTTLIACISNGFHYAALVPDTAHFKCKYFLKLLL